jgi:hypothetical protein
MREIDYNSQRDNFNFDGGFSGYKQCFSTCAWMFLSYYGQFYDGTDDAMLKNYVDEVEAEVGKAGIAEEIKKKYSWIKGKTSYWALVQQAAIQDYLPNKKIIFDEFYDIEDLRSLVIKGPVIIHTSKIGGLKGGHIILLVDYLPNVDVFVVNDPFGDARSNYKNDNGKEIPYRFDWLKKYINRGKGKCLVIYAE